MRRFFLLSFFLLTVASLYSTENQTVTLTINNTQDKESLSEEISKLNGEDNNIILICSDGVTVSDELAGWLSELIKGNNTITGLDLSNISEEQTSALKIFKGNGNLKTIKLFNIKELPADIFNGCSSLESLTIGEWNNESVDSYLTLNSIGNNAFYGCAKINIKNGFVISGSIGNDVFHSCNSLTDIPVRPSESNTTMRLGSNVFGECSQLIDVEIPDGIMEVGENAFAGCTNLKSITLSSKVTNINYTCISKCEKFEEFKVVDENKSLTAVDGIIYSKDKTELKLCPWTKKIESNYSWPSELKVIGSDAFHDCTEIGELTFTDGLTKIGGGAFRKSSITKITLPSTLKEIENGNYIYDCANLEEIIISGINNGTFVSVDGILYKRIDDNSFSLFSCPAQLSVNEKTIGIFTTGKYNKNTKEIDTLEQLTEKTLDLFYIEKKLNGSLTQLEQGAFYKNKTFVTLVLPDNITNIKDQTFEECAMKYLTIPYSLSQTGVTIMVKCTDFEAYIVDKRSNSGNINNMKIGAITYYTLEKFSVGSLGVLYDNKYEVLYSVPAQYIPANEEGIFKTYDNIRQIHSSCFRNTQNITEVFLSQGIMAVPHQCFYNSKIKSLTIPNSVVQFGQDMFQQCSELKDVYFLTTSLIVPKSQGGNYNMFWAYAPEGGATFHFSEGYDGLVEAYKAAGDEAGSSFKTLAEDAGNNISFVADIKHRALFEDDETVAGFNDSETIEEENKFEHNAPADYSANNIRSKSEGWNINSLNAGTGAYQYITLYRDFKSTGDDEFNTLALPFSLTRAQMKDKFEMLGQEASVYKFTGRKDNTICFQTINLHEGDDDEIVVKAGEAVLIKPTRKRHSYLFELGENNESVEITEGKTTSIGDIDPIETTGNTTKDINGNTVNNVTFRHGFYATYQADTKVGPYFYYVTAKGDIMYATKERNITKAFRGFIKGNEYDESTEVALSKINIDIDGVVTGLDNICIDGTTVISSGNVYCIDGRLMRKDASSLNGLSKGMYIVNGKKVVVK